MSENPAMRTTPARHDSTRLPFITACFSACLLAIASLGTSLAIAADAPATKPAKSDTTAPAKAPLPRVLIIGDSISMGYTRPVQKLLEGKAEVVRPAENCQHTGHGIKKIKAWLGDGKWDVIHFNWGIWDTHMVAGNGAIVKDEAKADAETHIRYTPEQYRENLESLVKTMEATGAKLVWASTTPIMSRTGERFEDIKVRNAIAAKIMKAHNIPIDDLYEAVLPNAAKWQGGDKVHFTAAGSDELAKLVAASIETALESKATPTKESSKEKPATTRPAEGK